jgi:serine/threonine protein kinase
MKLRPGIEVTPNVRLESHLASGAMGSVWIAEHMTLNTKVAVKFVLDRLDPDDPEVLERFIREASSAAQVKSSHVVRTFDQGVMRDGTPYIVMEYLDGEELGEKLERVERMDLGEVVPIIGQTAKALQMAHKVGIVHRDIKPGNIFLSTRDDELHVKVFDFGIAKIRHANLLHRGDIDVAAQLSEQPVRAGITDDQVMLGTPEYMSPEAVLNAASVDHHADLWSLAVVAYVCLTGELPFKGADIGDLCVALLEGKFVAASKLCPELPREVDLWFKKALAKDVDDRFQTAREMAEALAATVVLPSGPGELSLLSDDWDWEASKIGIPAHRAPLRSSAALPVIIMPKPRRSPLKIGAAVAAMLLVVGIGGFLMMQGADSDAPTTSTVSAEAETALTTTTSAPAVEPTASAAPSAAVSSKASAESSSAPPPKVYYPRGRRRNWGKPRPKNPGF